MQILRSARLALLFAALLGFAGLAFADAPAVGSVAPAFKLQDQTGKWHSLSDYKGKWVVLYFYPKDDTPGCTTQACGFRDNVFAFDKEGAVILGISVDSVADHKAFCGKARPALHAAGRPDQGGDEGIRRAQDLHGGHGDGASRHVHHRPAGPRREALRDGGPGRALEGRARGPEGAQGRTSEGLMRRDCPQRGLSLSGQEGTVPCWGQSPSSSVP